MGLFSKNDDDDFSDYLTLQRLLRREQLQKIQALGLLIAAFFLVLAIHFFTEEPLMLRRLLGLLLLLLGLSALLLGRNIARRHYASDPLYDLLSRDPRQIIWVYSVEYIIAPAGIYLYRRATLVLRTLNRQQFFLYGSQREAEAAKRALARILPQASFGYDAERAQLFTASPLFLWNENLPIPDDILDDHED